VTAVVVLVAVWYLTLVWHACQLPWHRLANGMLIGFTAGMLLPAGWIVVVGVCALIVAARADRIGPAVTARTVRR
jgi:hypothetical protein